MAPNFKMMALTMAMAFTSNQLLDSSNPSTSLCGSGAVVRLGRLTT